MRITKLRIKEGWCYPTGYGLCWIDWVTAEAVCYPIPFNWLARWFRDAYYFLCRGPRRRQFDAVQKAHSKEVEERYAGALNGLLELIDAWMSFFYKEAGVEWNETPPAVERAKRLLAETRSG